MLTSLSTFDWLRLIAAIILFLGPGFALKTLYPNHRRFDRTQTLTLSIGLSITAWSILLAWLHALRISLAPSGVLIILLSSWAIGLVRTRPWPRSILPLLDGSRIALWAVIITVAVVGVWALRDVVVGPGADIYHHTLITRLIVDQGGLPDNYLPYAPLVTFTYHFGFHGAAAAIVWLTGLSPIVVVPIVAQIIAAAAALSVAFLAETMIHRRSAATIGAVIAGLVSIFPAYYIDWGRYTQLTGLVLLPIFLGIVWQWAEADLDGRSVPFIGALAAGIVLAHYRVALMTASAVVIVIGLNGLLRRLRWLQWLQLIGRLLLAASIAGVLIAPWAWNVFTALQQGYPINLGQIEPVFFSLERLGPFVQNYPTNIVMITLIAIAVIVGWLRRERIVIGLSLWSVIMLSLSGPRFAGAFMDTVSVFISLYIPAAIVIAWLILVSIEWLTYRLSAARWIAWMGLILLSIWGAILISSIVDRTGAFVEPDDLSAMEWIRAHTPVSARFMVNVFHINFAANYVLGMDAGYWLPLLTDRAAIAEPMTYPSEHAASPDFLNRLVALDHLGGKLTSPPALALLHREGITYVYLGQRGGPISAAELMNSPNFKLVYQNKTVYVFEVVDAR